jgi:hypothetical protein
VLLCVLGEFVAERACTPQLGQRLSLQLARSLAAHSQLLADLAERALEATAVEPEAQAHYLRLLGCEIGA